MVVDVGVQAIRIILEAQRILLFTISSNYIFLPTFEIILIKIKFFNNMIYNIKFFPPINHTSPDF